MKKKIAIVRGAFLNRYEMQFYEPLLNKYDLTAFGSKKPFHSNFAFPTINLYSPMDLPNFPKKMGVLNRLFIDAHYLWGLENYLEGFDIVHTAETYYHYTQQALRLKEKGIVKKVVATVLENIPFNNEGIRGREQFKSNARNKLDHIIALTERTKTALILEGADENKITVIPHFIDTKRFAPVNKNQMSKDSRDIKILFVGRLEIYKGIYELIYAILLTKKDKELSEFKISCEFVGMGGEFNKLKSLVDELNLKSIIKFKTATYDEMPEIYKNADIFCAPSKSTPSWQEQYNTSLLEAQASGLAIVTTHSGGIPENVGNAGVLVSPDDIYSLYLAIKNFIKSIKLREEYIRRARDRAINVHDAQLGAARISTLYEQVLSNN